MEAVAALSPNYWAFIPRVVHSRRAPLERTLAYATDGIPAAPDPLRYGVVRLNRYFELARSR